MTDQNAYLKELEFSTTRIEHHVADIAGSLEKLRATGHNLVNKTIVLDDIANQLAAVSALAKSQGDVARAIGRMSDQLERIEKKWETESHEFRKRLGTLEATNG